MNIFANSRHEKYLPTVLSILLSIGSSLPAAAFGETKTPDRSKDIGVMLVDANPADRSRVSDRSAQIILPLCANSTETNCLDDVLIYKNGSTKVAAEYLNEAPGISMPARTDLGLPRSGDAQLFTPAANSGVKGNFAVKVVEQFFLDSISKKYKLSNFSVFVQPYTIEMARGFQSTSSYDWTKYAWGGDGQLGKIVDFQEDIRISVSVRIPKGEGGWFSGRVKDPLVNLTSDATSNKLSIDALPVSVPKLQVWAPTEEKTALMDKFSMSAGGNHSIESGFDDSVSWVEQLKPFAQDKSTSEETLWVVRSTYIDNPCFPDSKISGFITTNAMAYSWNPPVLQNGFLDYKVAGMHTTANGELTKGTYDLILSSETARCLYKFTSAPISATISIIGDASESKVVQTTVLSEREGFLKLSAYGFTFSSPVVRVKLDQKKNAPKKSISCLKGREIKKITSASPTCPKGFKPSK